VSRPITGGTPLWPPQLPSPLSRKPAAGIRVITHRCGHGPRLTRLATDTLVVLAGADLLQFGYSLLEEKEQS
jgi:hypothetical protein